MVTWELEKPTRQKFSIVSAAELTWLTPFPGIPSPNAKQEQEYLLGVGMLSISASPHTLMGLSRMWKCTLCPLWHLCKRQRFLREQFVRMKQTLVGFKNMHRFYCVQYSSQSYEFYPTVSHIYLSLGKFFIRLKEKTTKMK